MTNLELFERVDETIIALAISRPRIASIMRVEVLDQRTCEFCSYISGMIMDANDPRQGDYDSPHANCRGTWFYLTDDMREENRRPNWINPPQKLFDELATFIPAKLAEDEVLVVGGGLLPLIDEEGNWAGFKPSWPKE